MATADSKQPSPQDDSHTVKTSFNHRLAAISSTIGLITKKTRATQGWIWFKEARAEAWADIRMSRWRAARWLLIPCWQAAVLVGIVSISWAPATLSQFEDSACRPDGSFRVWGTDYNSWTINGFFQITIGMGTLTFTQAKVIDVAWDIVCQSSTPITCHLG